MDKKIEGFQPTDSGMRRGELNIFASSTGTGKSVVDDIVQEVHETNKRNAERAKRVLDIISRAE